MTNPPDYNEPPPDDPVPEHNVPIQHLLRVDPLDLTMDDCATLVTYYRNQRVVWSKAQEKPKTVMKSRTKLDSGATKALANDILKSLVGVRRAQKAEDESAAPDEEGDE